jgi:Kef-type K+ transport system membrane component KefB
LLTKTGISFGEGEYATFYVGMTCAISSTMIVVKLLSDMADMDSAPGRLTIGILIFQDIWAIIVLAIQPDLANPKIGTLLETFAKIAALIVIALAYAKFVMPAVFLSSSKNVELMLVLSLCWCFCMCSLAILPFVGLSMELAALISGVALATFPYSAEFNGKIKYIRDFFITLFFCGLGMQIPTPTAEPILKAFLIAAVVLAVRWIGIFTLVLTLGGGRRLAAVATINLSEVSEFALVICTLGKDYGHVEGDTLTILIWVFAILAVLSANCLPFNYQIYGFFNRFVDKLTKRKSEQITEQQYASEAHVDRNIVILGFHKIAAMLVADFEHHSPHLLQKLHVVDFHEELEPQLLRRGITFSYGDISAPDVLQHAAHGEVRLVICSIPDSLLRGTSNLKLLNVCKQVWPTSDVIVTCDNPHDAQILYDAGADYVLRMAKLCAERLHEIINEHATHHVHHHHAGAEMSLQHVFEDYKNQDHTRDNTQKNGVIQVTGATK